MLLWRPDKGLADAPLGRRTTAVQGRCVRVLACVGCVRPMPPVFALPRCDGDGWPACACNRAAEQSRASGGLFIAASGPRTQCGLCSGIECAATSDAAPRYAMVQRRHAGSGTGTGTGTGAGVEPSWAAREAFARRKDTARWGPLAAVLNAAKRPQANPKHAPEQRPRPF